VEGDGGMSSPHKGRGRHTAHLMDAERAMAASAGAALAAACGSVREAGPPDAVAGVMPAFVASPASTEEASALLAAAAAHGLTVVPRGAGTGLGWGQPPDSADLVVDMRRMDQVIEHAAGDLVAKVQAGATMGYLAAVLASAGQQLAVDAPAEATVGGVVATGTAGPRRFRYGAPRDLLIGITVVRADGVVAHSGGKVVKNVAGYDLGKLFSGSRGTLGLITEATFRLHPLPAAEAWVTGDFAPYSPSDLAGAAAAVAAAAGSALVPSAVELLWTGGPGSSPGPLVLRVGVLLEGTPSGVQERSKQMAELLAAAGATPIVAISETPFRWWEPNPESGSPGTVVRITFWVAQLAGVLEALAAAGASAGLRPAVSGAAGAGVLYARLDPDTADDTAARFVRALRDRLAGVFTRSADVSGLVRGSVTVLAAPAAVLAAAGPHPPVPGLDLMRAVKNQFDPGHRMFPGRVPWGQ
jgi:glycolate dehydrogenase FAD-binding subunit